MFWTIIEIFAAALMPFVFLLLSGLPSRTENARWGKGFDTQKTRESLAQLGGWRQRAHYAQLNGHEAFPPFAAAILCAHFAGVDPLWQHGLAVTFLCLRLVHGAVYIANLGKTRAVVWSTGATIVVAIFVLAARTAAERGL